jgi:hypothetical protein
MPIHDFDDWFASCADVAFGSGVLHLLQPLPRLVVPMDYVCPAVTDI